MDRQLERSERLGDLARKVTWGVVFVVFLVLALLLLPRFLQPSLARSEIRIARVEPGTVEETVTASGLVVPAFEKVLSSPVQARVLSILKQPGAIVEEGEEILKLDTLGLELELERLEQQQRRKVNERRELQLDLEDKLVELQSRIESQRLDVEILEFKERQHRTLYEEGLISEEQLRQAEVEARKAEIELRQLEASVESQRLNNTSKLASVELEIQVLVKERDEARRQLELAITRADRGGVLTWVVQEEGATVEKGEVLARIADLGSFRIESTVSDIHASRLRVGSEVQVLLGDDRLAATLTRIYPTIENGVARFESELENPSDPRLRSDLRVDVLVVIGRRDDTLRLRKGPFVQGQGAEQLAFVVDGDIAFQRQVRFGLVGHEYLEVVEGLQEGDEIIISAIQDFIHLDKIRLR